VTRWASLLIFVTVMLGGIVAATDSSSACPAWPACYADQVAPTLQAGWLENPAIEFVHRAIAFAGLVLLGVSGWSGRRSADPRVRVFPWVALGCASGSAVFGMMIILFELPLALGLLDLAFALIAMVLIAVTDRALRRDDRDISDPLLRSVTGWALGLLTVMHLLGSVVAGTTPDGHPSYTRALSWPLWHVVDIDRFPALQLVRIGIAAVAIVLVTIIVARGVRLPSLRRPSIVAAVLLVIELALGVVISLMGLAPTQTNGIDATIAVGYSAVAVALMWALAWILGGASRAADAGAEADEPLAVLSID
jgi:cytochrome c oxidase assembly protein subunit 15